ncbi:MAG: GNAT family N-acetyltransferase [Chloroflexota bacterium]|nr:GNAT family N-acetyltransferase [Chloroflexota bacterium]
MGAQLAVEGQVPFRGLRPLNPRRDLGQVADLIEEAFGGELEPGGIIALRDLRALARAGPLIGLMARSDPYLEDVLGGFVWIEENRVVGNVTVQRTDSYGKRWQIANVAVMEAYRGRGIGRILVEAGLDRIAQRHGKWAVLQVRTNNAIARGLYEDLGFEPLTEEANLQLPQVPRGMPTVELVPGMRLYDHEEWQKRYQLETVSRTGAAQWWRPVRSNQMLQTIEDRLAEKFWQVFGRNRVRRWVVERDSGLIAWLLIDARRWQGVHSLAFTVHPSSRGELEGKLVDFAMAFLADYPRWPVRVEHQGEHLEAIEALENAGFSLVRNHLSMRRRITKV